MVEMSPGKCDFLLRMISDYFTGDLATSL